MICFGPQHVLRGVIALPCCHSFASIVEMIVPSENEIDAVRRSDGLLGLSGRRQCQQILCKRDILRNSCYSCNAHNTGAYIRNSTHHELGCSCKKITLKTTNRQWVSAITRSHLCSPLKRSESSRPTVFISLYSKLGGQVATVPIHSLQGLVQPAVSESIEPFVYFSTRPIIPIRRPARSRI